MNKITDKTEVLPDYLDPNKCFHHVIATEETKCSHKACQECNGTGIKKSDGSACIHMLSCPCPLCTCR